ncbi:type II toxin-antitoxin system PemK/MazF family toxin [Macrococcoides caseolyticum]|uniref:type II toxin-antitoxin system PemK/MazF family toxin n=1 Tax=Macrococcoides caseolyticum TaxID=69966 RepID=UPI00105CECD4|nr:type II toxin-antitoxin system PemK/MazF family toxin [Macrococcus caseolyticus]TDM28752.1 type II toxin-antitoxin system PemK/MazF family toxin [Macrococcus caseolyticus]VUC64688.1 pemK-like family protein [Macrococcus caseolyticus]
MVKEVSQGDIFFVDFNPRKGYEQKDRRPALAISHDLVRDTSNLTIVVPISSTKRNFPMYHTLKSTEKVKGKVLLDQSIALDLKARGILKEKVVETIDKKELSEIISLYKLLFTID